MRLESTRILVKNKVVLLSVLMKLWLSKRKPSLVIYSCMHFLAKHEIAHTNNFTPLVELAKSLGVVYLGEIAMAKKKT